MRNSIILFFLFTLVGIFYPILGQWQPHIIVPNIDRPAIFDCGDIDGDGDLDLGATSWGDGKILWYRNNSLDTTWTPFLIDNTMSGPVGMVLVDVDGDDTVDVVSCAGSYTDDVVWYKNMGGDPIDWHKQTIDSDFNGAETVRVGDIDGDGNKDVVACGRQAGLIKWYENDGSNPINWIEHIVDNTISYPVTVCIADIDNDDDMDIVACESDFGEIVWYENIGGTPINWKRHIIDINGSGGAFVVDVGDIDGDDYLDVAVTGYHQNNVYWCKNNLPDTVWTKHIVDDSFGDALDVRIADVDLDFDLDLLVTGRIANAVVWYENDLPNTTWAMNCIDCSLVGANSVAAYDMDGDGDLDAIAGSWSEANGIINWYENPFSGWSRQYSGTTESLLDVSFTDPSTATVTGTGGTILRSTNGGITWENQTSGTSNNLPGVFFTDNSTGTAVGDNGTILNTTDGGLIWENQTSGTSHNLRGVFFTDATTGTAVGDNGTILQTTDGGSTWVSRSGGGANQLWGVFFTDSYKGTIVGGDGYGGEGIILQTTDGGVTWEPRQSGTWFTLTDVFFPDANFGFVSGVGGIAGDHGQILRTTDGGSTWESVSSGISAGLYGVFFTDANKGTVVGGWAEFGEEWGFILRTTDGGITWNNQLDYFELYGISFIDEVTGIAVGHRGVILHTTTAGMVTGIEEDPQIDREIPTDYYLSNNYPNPFNPNTTIKYQIPKLSFVILKIYDVLGNEIATLINEEKPAGSYEVEFDGTMLTSGIYFYRLQAGDFIQTKKMVLMK